MTTNHRDINFLNHNQASWNKQAKAQSPWSQPVSSELITAAKSGTWDIYLTPKPLPKEWLGNVKGKKILCLASAGGQQAPLLAALGAAVTVFDLSDEQLLQDRIVAERDGLNLITIQGDMCDLSIFDDQSFDMIFHPISNHYVPDVRPVWRESFRVLKTGGALLASFYNPVLFIGDRDPEYMEKGLIYPRYKIPYSDLRDMEESASLKNLISEAIVFGHSLTDLIGGQLTAGFIIEAFLEDFQPVPRFLFDKYIPTFLATKAVKQK